MIATPTGKASADISVKRQVLPMVIIGSLVLFLEWLFIKAIISGVGILPDGVVFMATYGPIFAAAGVGEAISQVARGRDSKITWLPSAISGILILPLALTDPWVIIALGMKGAAPLALRLFLLALPVIIAAGFAHPWLSRRKLEVKILVLLIIIGALYMGIYKVILPTANPL